MIVLTLSVRTALDVLDPVVLSAAKDPLLELR